MKTSDRTAEFCGKTVGAIVLSALVLLFIKACPWLGRWSGISAVVGDAISFNIDEFRRIMGWIIGFFILIPGICALVSAYIDHFFDHSSEDGQVYIETLALVRRITWKNLSEKKILKYLFYAIYLIKHYCLTGASFIPVKIAVPDKVISSLTSKQLAGLIQKTIGKKGKLKHLCYNLELTAQKLVPLAISRPAYYKKKIGNKLSLALKKKSGR